MSLLTPARFGGAALLGVLLLVASPRAALAAEAPAAERTREYDLKAAFLFNFARFAEWPADAFASDASPITIGILGEDPFGGSLEDIIADETVRDRKLTVRRYGSAEEVGPCQILFVAVSQAARWESVAPRFAKRSILTVGDGGAFADHGGMIGFEMVHNHLRLHINLAAARTARITISSQLLRQATIVGPEVAP